MKKIAFIGCGNMGQAMLSGILRSGWSKKEDVVVHSHGEGWQESIREEYGVQIADSNRQATEEADLIVLAVKPSIYSEVLKEIGPALSGSEVICGIAPSFSIDALRRDLGSERGWVVRAMPNTPALVGAGISGYCFEEGMPEAQAELARGFFEAFGQAVEVKEELMAAVGSVSGSAPAYIYMVIEAMTQGGIALGLTAEQAQSFAASTVAGAAKMVQERGEHPARLREQVSSAGGTTIAGVNALEKSGFKGALIEAMEASAQRFREMEKETFQKE